jgi:dihydroxyacetone kinase-like protein
MEYFNNENSGIIVCELAQAIKDNKEYLSEVDGTIGDGDHGINMNKGFALAAEKLGEHENLSDAFGILGSILMDEIGGSMGPIYGSFFLDMSSFIEDVSEINQKTFGDMLAAGLQAIRDIVPTDLGDKTLLDALIPAVEAYSQKTAEGASFAEALTAASKAADTGRDATRDMIAKVGRASRLGERSRGVLDVGATSCAIIINTLCNSVKTIIQ